MMAASVLGVGVWGPGLWGWPASRPVLAGRAAFDGRECPPPPSTMLSATERRRTSSVVRLALHVAQEACAMSGLEAGALSAVFGTSNGDGAVMHAILQSLAAGEGHVSPTQFHNSVHNAAAGYWTIGAGSRQAATAIGCYDDTAGAALLNAMTELHVDQVPVLLCVYDLPLPEPLHAKRPVQHGFGAALVLAPSGVGHAIAKLEARYAPSRPDGEEGPDEGAESQPSRAPLLALSRGNPAAHLLPLLQALAGARVGTVRMPLLEACLHIAVTPCSITGASPP